MNTNIHSKQQFWCAVYLSVIEKDPLRNMIDLIAIKTADRAIQDYEERFGNLEPGAAKL